MTLLICVHALDVAPSSAVPMATCCWCNAGVRPSKAIGACQVAKWTGWKPSKTPWYAKSFEETGLHVHLQHVLCIVSYFEPDLTPPEHWVAPVYLAAIQGSEHAVRREPEAILAVGWFALDALPSPLTTSTVQALQHLHVQGLPASTG